MEDGIFIGSKDDNRITLEEIIPDSDITVSSPFRSMRRFDEVVIEGNFSHISRLFSCVSTTLLEVAIDNKFFGRWMDISPIAFYDEEESNLDAFFKIYYDSFGAEKNKIVLLPYILQKHLISICRLKLSRIYHSLIVVNGFIVHNKLECLPKRFNGIIEFSIEKNGKKM